MLTSQFRLAGGVVDTRVHALSAPCPSIPTLTPKDQGSMLPGPRTHDPSSSTYSFASSSLSTQWPAPPLARKATLHSSGIQRLSAVSRAQTQPDELPPLELYARAGGGEGGLNERYKRMESGMVDRRFGGQAIKRRRVVGRPLERGETSEPGGDVIS